MTSLQIDHPDNAEPVVAGSLSLGTFGVGSLGNGLTFSSSVLDVSSFAHILIGANGVALGPNLYTIQGYSDAGGTLSQGVHWLWQDNTPANKYMPLTPIAPYLVVSVENLSGGPQGYGFAVYGFTSLPPLGSIVMPQAQGSGVIVVPGSGSSTANLSNCYPGVSYLHARGVDGAGLVEVSVWNGTAWVDMAGLEVSANSGQTTDIALPFSDVRFNFQNGISTGNRMEAILTGPI